MKKSKAPQIFEAVFILFYLLFDLIAAVIFFVHGQNPVFFLFGWLTLILAGGDAFHLIPRVLEVFVGKSKRIEWWKGLGLLISSITMTIFYLLLFYIWLALFPTITYPSILFWLIWISALLRIVLCLFPQNNWFKPEGDAKWSLVRNAPFIVTGLCLIILFLISDNIGGYGLWQMAAAIAISFACYLPVVFLAKKKPAIGMLMIPKTIAYIYMISLGLSLIGKLA